MTRNSKLDEARTLRGSGGGGGGGVKVVGLNSEEEA